MICRRLAGLDDEKFELPNIPLQRNGANYVILGRISGALTR